MKKSAILLSSLLSIFFISSFVQSNNNDCKPYFPMKQGAVLKYEDYDSKEKLTSSSQTTVLSVTESGSKIDADIEVISYDKKGKETYKTEYPVSCENGKFNISMKAMLPGETMEAYEAMSVSFTADNLVIPSDASVGSTLPDASIKATIDGAAMAMPIITMNVVDRKVVAEEKLTVAAGTYDCLKLTYKVNSKIMMVKVNSDVTEWFAKGIGTVKQETYKSSNGKLLSKRVLVSASL